MLGLQDDYRLLADLGDQLGRRFTELGLDERKRSPLVSRNHSILAHGFDPVGPAVFEKLKAATLSLAEIDERQLPVFPTLGR